MGRGTLRATMLAAALLVACGPPPRERIHVRQQEYEEDWPFTTEEGWLECKSGTREVSIWTGGGSYALNGKALRAMDLRGAYRPVQDVLRPGFYGLDLGNLIERGLELCDY